MTFLNKFGIENETIDVLDMVKAFAPLHDCYTPKELADDLNLPSFDYITSLAEIFEYFREKIGIYGGKTRVEIFKEIMFGDIPKDRIWYVV